MMGLYRPGAARPASHSQECGLPQRSAGVAAWWTCVACHCGVAATWLRGRWWCVHPWLGLGPRLGLGLELELDVDVAGTSERDENATGDGDLERRRPRQVDQR